MESAARKKARAFVVVGLALIAVGSIINVIRGVTSVDNFALMSTLTLFQLVLSPLVGLAAVWSWWWLSKICVNTGEQVTLVRRGLYGLALQNTMSTAMVLALLFQLPTFNRDSWNVAPFWAQFWGLLVLSIGFVLLARQIVIDTEDSNDGDTDRDAVVV
jgi:protein-S-isoprenylcysteine O-methyltransferase Ste14